jgi:tetratricopeptide (TPR) repeat protein
VQRDGNRVRITTELIDARTDETLWSDSYQRDLTDIFAIQNEIAETVASKLRAQLSPEEQKKIGEWPTTNLEAYDLYLQAKDLLADSQNAPDSNWPKAIKLVEQAIQKDPKFTLAYCFAAKAHADMYHFWMDRTPERRALADAAVDEALRLEPDSPEAHLAEAYHLYESYGNYERASVQVQLALKALPNSSEALGMAARVYMRIGRWEESTRALEKAHELDPQNPGISSFLGGNYRALRRFREAEQLGAVDASYLEFIRTGAPKRDPGEVGRLQSSTPQRRSNGFWFALYVRDWTAASQILAQKPDEDLYSGELVKVPIPHGCGEIWLEALQGKRPTLGGRFKIARDQLAQRVEANPDDVQLLSVLGAIDALLGQKQEALEEATRAAGLQRISPDALKGREILWNLVAIYIWTNEPGLAFEKLAVAIKTPPLPPSRAVAAADPTFDPIRKDPRFDKLLAQIPTYP